MMAGIPLFVKLFTGFSHDAELESFSQLRARRDNVIGGIYGADAIFGAAKPYLNAANAWKEVLIANMPLGLQDPRGNVLKQQVWMTPYLTFYSASQEWRNT
ncbi:hypothetical protein CNMCM8927_001564 [Aspergillus lentulus]|uniref:Uncharacterized protein n=1 Tax=Aspergillus lentulus TaxID=293939 RepID=A0AAN5YIU3_ASPLE|nr:hypothetical protein CNMCM8927_001564 [Aspergillus lentulus]